MGKIRIKTLGLDEVEKKQKAKADARREAKKLKPDKIDKPEKQLESVEISKPDKPEESRDQLQSEKQLKSEKEVKQTKSSKTSKSPQKTRGAGYLKAKKQVDNKKLYSITDAVILLKKINFVKFDPTVELHLVCNDKDIKGEVILPHSTGKTTRVVIVDDKVLENIEGGKFEFDILISHPQYMAKLAKFANVLGPKGLMPNPKAGTVTDKPEEVAKKYQKGNLKFKTEKEAPLIHQILGKLSLENKALEENYAAFIGAVGAGKIKTAYICSSMSPSIKINIAKVEDKK